MDVGFDVERFEGAGVHPEDAVLVGIQGHRTTVLGQIGPQIVSPGWSAGTKCSTISLLVASSMNTIKVQHGPRNQSCGEPSICTRSPGQGRLGAPLVNPGCFALLGLPQTLGDHPLSQRLDRQPVTVLLHQLLTGQRGVPQTSHVASQSRWWRSWASTDPRRSSTVAVVHGPCCPMIS